LTALESSGSTEKAMHRQTILPLVLNDERALLFQELLPQPRAQEPPRLDLMAVVSAKDLFSVLAMANIPPAQSLPDVSTPLEWGEEFLRGKAQYLPATLKVSFGTLNIFWKKTPGKTTDLVTEESPGAGELPTVEKKLLLWFDESSGTAFIFHEMFPLLNQKYVPYLVCLARVKSDVVLSGFKRLLSN
jgi:hypothetical protein